MVILGEVGLTGNVRSIPRIEQRINEAKKLGFKKFIIPEGNYKQIKDNDSSIKIRRCQIYTRGDAARIFIIRR